MTQQPFSGWIANLSSGETAFEGTPMPGERTPWQQLLQHCRETGLRITGMFLARPGIRINALPQKQCSGYYQAYESQASFFGKGASTRQGIGSVVGDKVYITWIDENNNIFQDIRPLDVEKIHTTLS